MARKIKLTIGTVTKEHAIDIRNLLMDMVEDYRDDSIPGNREKRLFVSYLYHRIEEEASLSRNRR